MSDTVEIHPWPVRVTHWINVVAIAIMATSGWRIYNASPLFDFRFPNGITLGGWLAGALQWHFAAMWLLALNGLGYVLYGILSGHYRRSFFPLTPRSVLREIGNMLHGRLSHDVGVYNPIQKTAYVGVIIAIVLTVLSGLAIWKPVQFQGLAALMGDYPGARLIHFVCMTVIVLFVVVHVTMVMIVPRTFLPMWTGRARKPARSEP